MESFVVDSDIFAKTRREIEAQQAADKPLRDALVLELVDAEMERLKERLHQEAMSKIRNGRWGT